MVTTKNKDAFGQMLLEQHKRGEKLFEIYEREDNYIDAGSRPGYYISEFKDWLPAEKQAIKYAKGRVLDIGSGAGRHSIYLQQKGLDVTGIDNSAGAVKVSKLRGLKKAMVRSIGELSRFQPNSFDTVLMMGNNFGLVGSPERASKVFGDLSGITVEDGCVLAATLNPYGTTNPDHKRYHKLNRSRGRPAGQLTMRTRFASIVGDWFNYLFVSPDEMEKILEDTNWRVAKLLGPADGNYIAVLVKRAAD